jgi:small subunit ribosomal protein S17
MIKMEQKKYSLHGRTFVGVVTSTKMHKTAIVEWSKRIKIPKYDRFMIKKKKKAAHVPEDITVKVGDMVRIKETRPISKTKTFIIVEKIGFKKEHIIKEDTKDDADQTVHKKKKAETKEQKE